MFAFRHIALASAAGLALSLGVVGCAPEKPDVVPIGAQLSSSGNAVLAYSVPADGTVYVYDHAAQRLIWSGMAFKGQMVNVDPDKSQITVGSSIVVNKLAAPTDQKDIYFQPSPTPSQPQTWNNNSNSNGVTVTPSVIVQPSNGSNNGAVTVQPGVQVTPAQPTNP